MKRFTDLSKVVAEGVAVFLFAATLVLQSANVLFRYTKIRAPSMWVEEFSTFAFIWILFLLWHLADRQGAHFMVDFLRHKLPPRLIKLTDALSHIVALLFAVLVVWRLDPVHPHDDALHDELVRLVADGRDLSGHPDRVRTGDD